MNVEADPSQTLAARSMEAARNPGARRAPRIVAFDRYELNKILWIYGRMVSAGEWRDYAIDHSKDAAVFAIYRRTSEAPIYRIEKRPALARRQGAYAVIGQAGQVLKRGHELFNVLRVLDAKTLKVVAGGKG